MFSCITVTVCSENGRSDLSAVKWRLYGRNTSRRKEICMQVFYVFSSHIGRICFSFFYNPSRHFRVWRILKYYWEHCEYKHALGHEINAYILPLYIHFQIQQINAITAPDFCVVLWHTNQLHSTITKKILLHASVTGNWKQKKKQKMYYIHTDLYTHTTCICIVALYACKLPDSW